MSAGRRCALALTAVASIALPVVVGAVNPTPLVAVGQDAPTSVAVNSQTRNLAGQWQGSTNPANELRLVFVLATNSAGGGYTATLHRI